MTATATATKVKETGMIFQPHSIAAINEGRKTQTRRVITDAPEAATALRLNSISHYLESYLAELREWVPVVGRHGCETMVRCPYGRSGDRIYVKEGVWTYSGSNEVHYSSDEPPPKESKHFGFQWYCHQMPKIAARLWLEIRDVRVERLQEITNQDARAEGPSSACPHRHGPQGIYKEVGPGVIGADPYAHRHDTGWNDCWICAFKMGWDSINATRGYSWEQNPFVWAIQFRKV